MLNVLTDCCETLLHSDDLFWVTAALTDCSFETGSNTSFRRAIRSFADAGLPRPVVDRLNLGVNGNLASLLEFRHPHVKPIEANKGRGKERPDIRFPIGCADEAIVEVKVIHGQTIPAFYGHKEGNGVAHDRDKLLAIRREGFLGHLFQVVYFTQLPAFEYPAGDWYSPATVRYQARSDYAGFRRISEQYRYLRTFLPETPAWPSEAPAVHELSMPEGDVLECITRRFGTVFRPDDPSWAFSPVKHFADAAAGCAIWEF